MDLLFYRQGFIDKPAFFNYNISKAKETKVMRCQGFGLALILLVKLKTNFKIDIWPLCRG